MIRIEEPFLTVSVFTPVSYMDSVMELAKRKRGIFVKSEYVSDRMKIVYDLSLIHISVSMIQKAMERAQGINTVEELLNEIYKQRIKA